MRKIALLLITFASLFSLFAESFKSNVLMQRLPDDSDTDYMLVVKEDGESLYQKDVLIKYKSTTYAESFDVTIKTICIEDYINNSKEVFTYKNNLLYEYSYSTNDSLYSEINTFNENNYLIFTTFLNDSEESEVVFYIRDLNSGKLLGTKTVNSYNWNEGSYLVDNDLILTDIGNGTYIENEFSVSEDNVISYTNNGIDYKYSMFGLLLEESDGLSTIKYTYSDDYKLESSESFSDNERVFTEYSDGVARKSYTYKSDILTETSVYKSSGMVKTLYSNQIPVAEVYYDKNNIKVVDIRYLN